MTRDIETRRTLRLIAFCALLFFAFALFAAAVSPTLAAPVRGEGGLFLFAPDKTGKRRPAPAVASKVDIRVSGAIGRATVRQEFVNPDDTWVEGVYVFPLPDEAAVDHLKMWIGDRVIEGRIEERRAAKRRYDQAARAGKGASLLEQERANIFTMSIANIPPKGRIAIEIAFGQPVTVEDGRHRIAIPLVVTPRYVPRGEAILGVGGLGDAHNTAEVPDAERITPPMRHPDDPKANPVALTVALDPGAPLATIESPYHSIGVAETDGRYEVTLKQGAVPADRDFVLEWTTDTGAEPHAALFTELKGDDSYLLAMVSSPSVDVNTGGASPPREAIFIIDTSGSMHGASMNQAKKALLFALDRLRAQDRFNVIAFASESTILFPAARPADAPALSAAHGFVGSLTANGGTEIMGALGRALNGRVDTSRLRQIVLLTDGAVGNETAILRMIRRHLGDSRLFTVGIGSAPNGYLMRKAAEIGRGSALRIGKPAEVERRMTALFRKLERPVLTDLVARFPDEARTESLPAAIPDLYHGEPIVLAARLPKAEGRLILTGRLMGRAWRQEVDLSTARPGGGVARLWARRKIESHMDRLHAGGKGDEVRLAVLDLALEHQLLSRYTSLVAVDDRTTRPQDESLDTRAVPGNAPAGWTPPHQARKQIRHAMAPTGPAGIASAGPRGAGGGAAMAYSMRAMPDAARPSYAPPGADAAAYAMRMAPSVAPSHVPAGAPATHVPTISLGVRTATPAQIMIATGLVLLMLSAGIWWGARRRAG